MFSGKATNVYSTHSEKTNLSRTDMLLWVNDTLQADCLKIEEMGTGAAYCLMMDLLFPGCVPMHRIKLSPNSEHEYVQNFKLLQAAFKTHHVTRDIPVDRLIKVRFQDNFMFLQWFYKFFMANKTDRPYDPVVARGGRPFGEGAVAKGSMRGGAKPKIGGSAGDATSSTSGAATGRTGARTRRLSRGSAGKTLGNSPAAAAAALLKSVPVAATNNLFNCTAAIEYPKMLNQIVINEHTIENLENLKNKLIMNRDMISSECQLVEGVINDVNEIASRHGAQYVSLAVQTVAKMNAAELKNIIESSEHTQSVSSEADGSIGDQN